MALDLRAFSLLDMLRCGNGLHRATADTDTMEQAAESIIRYLYEQCGDGDGSRQCAMVRFYKTHAYGRLPEDLKEFVRLQLGGAAPDAAVKCLTLLGTAGDQPEWNSRHESRGHRAIPLLSVEVVERAPMIAQLIRQLGLEVEPLIHASAELLDDAEGRTYNVFHVETAPGSPYIPAQAEFVEPFGIASVLGFGGLLPSGDLFAVILFSRVTIPRASAERFRKIAADVKASIFHFGDERVFAQGASLVEA
ncbi:MAG TPA: hypothetical protein VFE05_03935 [Longimicrobiaceae bacterium]|jgi:hypothetical protein|nr:hypothetical protein [Longimicrobiaceae bacterium]